MNTDHHNDPKITRVCPFCAETIQVSARLCPRCRQWLSWRSLRNPAFGIPFTLVLLMTLHTLLAVKVSNAFSRVFNPPPYYSQHLGAVEVVSSRFNWVETKDGTRIYLTGLLTNRSEHGWQSVEFDCRFFNAAGIMVDAVAARGNVTLQPHDDGAFRAVVNPGRQRDDYETFKISVSNARIINSTF